MLFTERNQPMRVCAVASGFSMRTFGMANGRSISPMPSSNAASCFGSGAKIETMVGAHGAVQPRHHLAVGIEPGFEVLDRHRVEVVVVQVVLARPGQLHRLAVHLLRDQRRLDDEIGLRLAAEAAAEQA